MDLAFTWLSVLAWVLSPLALFRLSHMFVYEDGPFDIFFLFRHWAGVYDLAENDEPKSELGKLFSCPLCVGVWLGLFILILLLIDWRITNLFLIWMGMCGIQIYLHFRTDV